MLRRVIQAVVYLFAGIGFFLVAGYFAVRFGVTNEEGIIDVQREVFLGDTSVENEYVSGPWQESEEWQVLEEAIRRDEAVITKVADDADVSPRLIVANLVAEQLRLFFTEREAYKKWFYPLKILGPQSQFSWGVMGMKEDTAILVETNLTNPASPLYPGPEYAHLLNFPDGTTDVATVRFTRMTDQHDHYWSYLYAALYLKQIETQWARAGFPITGQVDVISTLYNIGFSRSVPKADPQVGGAAITAGDQTYSFGGLAADFYNSDLLIDIFPR